MGLSQEGSDLSVSGYSSNPADQLGTSFFVSNKEAKQPIAGCLESFLTQIVFQFTLNTHLGISNYTISHFQNKVAYQSKSLSVWTAAWLT